MPGHGKRGNRTGGRGRGGAGVRGGRGKGRGGGGGNGRNRELIPSAIGYVYRPRSNVDELDDDFRIYGQFGSDDEIDSETEARPFVPHKKAIDKLHQKKDRLGFVKESRPSFGSNYGDDNAVDRAGLGASSSSGQQHAAVQFAKGKSKYLKTVLFTRSSSSIDLTKVEDALIQEQTPVSEQTLVEASVSSLPLDDATIDEKLLAKKELWSILKGRNLIADVADAAAAMETTEPLKNENPLEQMNSSSNEEDSITTPDHESSDQDDTLDEENDQGTSDDDQTISSQDELDGTEEDELLEEDMLIMQDYMENIDLEDEQKLEDWRKMEDEEKLEEDWREMEAYFGVVDLEDEEKLEEDWRKMEAYFGNIKSKNDTQLVEDCRKAHENLNGLLAWSAMQTGNPQVDLDGIDDDLYDYATLDEPTTREVCIMEEEERKLTKKKSKTADEDRCKKVGHRSRDDDSIVDSEIFGQTLKAALADVPPGLRPGMRSWYEKQQRKEDRKKKKEEAKAHKKENKKNGKGKAKYMEDEDLTDQMAKIDERIRGFVQDASISSFQFAPMATNVRRQLHVLAAAYNLKSKSTGGGGSRCTVVTKTPTTYIPNDRRYISRFLSDIQTNMNEQNRIIGKNNAKGFQKGKKKFINSSKKSISTSTPKDKRGDSQFSVGPSHGTVVASDAAPIDESNVGHRMLAAMGWKQGEALGSKSEGIVAPIVAIIRKKGRGLGS